MDKKSAISKTTLETLARSFFKESSSYGFQKVDYVRFVNLLLDHAMQDNVDHISNSGDRAKKVTRLRKQRISTGCVSLPLSGDRIKIRAFDEPGDRSSLEGWLKDDYGRFFILSCTTAKTMEIDRIVQNDQNRLGIVTLQDDHPIGVVAYLDYDVNQRKAELRKLIGRAELRGKGYGKEATALWIEYGFAGLNLKKIYLNTFDTNIRNIKLNEELGFRVEGILRNEVYLEGEYKDLLRMGMWRD